MVAAVRKLVASAVIKADAIEKKAAKAWEGTEPRREKMRATATKAFGTAEKKMNTAVVKTVQIKNDILAGFRQGMKDAKSAIKAKP